MIIMVDCNFSMLLDDYTDLELNETAYLVEVFRNPTKINELIEQNRKTYPKELNEKLDCIEADWEFNDFPKEVSHPQGM